MATVEKNGKTFVQQRRKLSEEEIVARLRQFHHNDAADLIEELLEYKWKYTELEK